MDKQNTKLTASRFLISAFILSLFQIGLMATTSAQQIKLRHLDEAYNVERSRGSRLKEIEYRRCKGCEEKESKAKLKYLERVLSEEGSASYQSEIESLIFTDSKFANGCWKKANKKGMEIFFTIDKSGSAGDFAWFPKNKAGKCVKKHISKIEFPDIEKPHHAWLVASKTAR